MQDEIDDLKFRRTEAYNLKLTLNTRKERDKVKETNDIISDCDKKIKALEKTIAQTVRAHKQAAKADLEFAKYYAETMAKLKEEYKLALQGEITEDTVHRNEILGKEIYLSVGRYGALERFKLIVKLILALRKAMRLGVDLTNDEQLNQIFDPIAFRVKFLDGTTETQLHGVCVLNLAKIKYTKDWQKIRGTRIATVFQDPMTSLNPIITIGKQISSIIIKHQHCSEAEARRKAVELMKKVGIPNAENRYDDYPFQYSGGMRQRIVIAIALSCQPKILICDEPTTALDVTIQAQILKLIKDLQKNLTTRSCSSPTTSALSQTSRTELRCCMRDKSSSLAPWTRCFTILATRIRGRFCRRCRNLRKRTQNCIQFPVLRRRFTTRSSAIRLHREIHIV